MPEFDPLASLPAASPRICVNRRKISRPPHYPDYKPERIAEVASFLINIGASATPLHSLTAMAKKLGLAAIHVKDESQFMGLNAFKARGALWAIAKACNEKFTPGEPIENVDKIRWFMASRRLLFTSATDGNHGAAVAYTAKLLGQPCHIFMPKGSTQARVAAIAKHGAICKITDRNYDETVRIAADFASQNSGLLIQDTAWPGYERIPAWIMQGYATIAQEALRQLNGVMPTHVLLQAGVGSFAAAIIQAFREAAQDGETPVFISLEPEKAACVYESVRAGESQTVIGDLATMMAGLACGQPSFLAWPVLRDNLAAALRLPDIFAALGMRTLAWPCGSDPAIISGESGAIGMGALPWLASREYPWRERLGMNNNSRVLLISTEGATDPDNWERIAGKRL